MNTIQAGFSLQTLTAPTVRPAVAAGDTAIEQAPVGMDQAVLSGALYVPPPPSPVAKAQPQPPVADAPSLPRGVAAGVNGTLLMEEPAGTIESRHGLADAAQGNAVNASMAATGLPLPSLVTRYFQPAEFASLNAGFYHDEAHPVNVAVVGGELAQNFGFSQKDVKLVEQSALLHDADERKDMASGEVKTGTPARAQVTLAWMDDNKASLQDRFGWNDVDFTKAQALIARTDFPFDDKSRTLGTRYDGQSPRQVYEGLLNQLPVAERAGTMRLGAILRFADQVGNYTGSFAQAREAVSGLARELRMDESKLMPTTPGFLGSAGNDLDLDRDVAARVGVDANVLPGRDVLVATLSADKRQNLSNNARQFAALLA
ncbi:MAG: hypothetical protein FJX76_15765 [Armatimonadetes bacterium]|nr:hypothetical protein [Armatimonadota bacterium]